MEHRYEATEDKREKKLVTKVQESSMRERRY